MGVLPSSASVNSGEFAVPLPRVGSLAPAAQVVVYALMASGEAVADSQDFPVQLCLNNKVHLQPAQPPAVVGGGGQAGLTLLSLQVSLKFSSLQELPAEKTTLSLKAHPGSLCSVRAIDQSVLLLQAEEELTVSSVGCSALAAQANNRRPAKRGRVPLRSSSSCPTRSCPGTRTTWRTSSRTPASLRLSRTPWSSWWCLTWTMPAAPSAPSTSLRSRRTTSTASSR